MHFTVSHVALLWKVLHRFEEYQKEFCTRGDLSLSLCSQLILKGKKSARTQITEIKK